MTNEMGAEAGPEKSSAPMLVLCISCNTPKDASDFKKNRRSCRECTNKSSAGRMTKKRRASGIPLFKDTQRPWLAKGMPYHGTYAVDENGTRECISCGERKHKSEFYEGKRRVGGIGCSCKPCSATVNKAYREKMGRGLRLKRYGLTLEQYDQMFSNQDGKCAICASTDPKGNGRFCVDHDHSTGIVRALLCNPCNWGIGHLREDPIIFRSAMNYLEIHKTAQTADAVHGKPVEE